jgi:cell division protein FtsX
MGRPWSVAAVLWLGLLAGCTETVAPIPTPPTTTPPTTSRLVVFLVDDATAAQKSTIEARLRALPGATEVSFETREEAYRRFKELFKDQPDLVNRTKPADLPESYRVTLAGAVGQSTLAEIRRLPGVDQITEGSSAQPTPATPTR